MRRVRGGSAPDRTGPRRWLLAAAVVAVLSGPWLLAAATGPPPVSLAAGADTASGVSTPVVPVATEPDTVELLYFGADGCPYCAHMEVFLDELEDQVGPALEVRRFEVSQDPMARSMWQRELHERGHEARGVPSTVLDDQVWVGFDESIAAEITLAVEQAVDAADDAAEPEPTPSPPDPTGTTDEVGTIHLPVLGEVELAERSSVGVTALIAFVDGFNPCSLWVLTVLLAMVLNAGASRGRVAAVGVTFLTVTGLIYGAFIVGLFTVLGFIEQLGAIRAAVAVVALVVGLVNIKDFFAYKRGLSFTIPDRYKPRIYRGGRAIRDQRRSLLSVLATTVVLATGVALIELPCTAGFPVIWTGTLRSMGIEGGAPFTALLLLYLLIYVGLELVLFGVVVVTLRMTQFEERHGRALKLVGGSLMVALGVVMVAAPQLLDDLGGLLAVTLGAVALAALLAGLGRLRRGGDADRHPPVARRR